MKIGISTQTMPSSSKLAPHCLGHCICLLKDVLSLLGQVLHSLLAPSSPIQFLELVGFAQSC